MYTFSPVKKPYSVITFKVENTTYTFQYKIVVHSSFERKKIAKPLVVLNCRIFMFPYFHRNIVEFKSQTSMSKLLSIIAIILIERRCLYQEKLNTKNQSQSQKFLFIKYGNFFHYIIYILIVRKVFKV